MHVRRSNIAISTVSEPDATDRLRRLPAECATPVLVQAVVRLADVSIDASEVLAMVEADPSLHRHRRSVQRIIDELDATIGRLAH